MIIYEFINWICIQICIYFELFPIIVSSLTKQYNGFNFKIYKQFKKARRGVIYTPHGNIQTPAFIFCATKASMKSTTINDVIQNNTQIILSNTYHLFLKGYDTIKKLGGLHKALGFNKPMLTDSGGYQVFAMNFHSVSKDIKGAKNRTYKPTLIKVNEDGATFRSYYDSSIVKLTPEKSIQVQIDLGADFIVVFDECTSSTISKKATQKSMEMSHRWETRSLEYFHKHQKGNQSLYGIVQGGTYKDLRKISCNYVNSKPFFGICVGGCLGESTEEMHQTVNYVMNKLVKDRPVHLLGIGYLEDIFNGVEQGIDTFDCVHPSRIARHGVALIPKTRKNQLDLSKGRYKNDNTKIWNECKCSTCKIYKKSYIHMLIKSGEHMAYNLITNHNIYFMNKVMEDIRYGIEIEDLESVKRKYI